jgi:hypothetical protein
VGCLEVVERAADPTDGFVEYLLRSVFRSFPATRAGAARHAACRMLAITRCAGAGPSGLCGERSGGGGESGDVT